MDNRVGFRAGKDGRGKRGFFGLHLSPDRPTQPKPVADTKAPAHEESAAHDLWELDTFDTFSEFLPNSEKRARRGDFSKNASNASNASKDLAAYAEEVLPDIPF